MKNKKVMIILMVIISILLVVGIMTSIVTFAKIDIFKIANNANTAEEQSNNEANNVIDIANNDENNTVINEQNTDEQNVIEENKQDNLTIQEKRIALVEKNKTQDELIATLSSRSDIDRTKVYVNTNKEMEQAEDEYEEIKNYKKLEEVKISFDMDVSKTTGLSKKDFVSFVQNMKCDRTKILAKNAAWIWECCQKYNVNEIFVLGICGIESAWCSAPQHQRTHNYSSLMTGGKLIPYATDEQGFEAMIKLLGERYLTPGASFYHGATITGVGRCYCNPTSWPKKVFTCMQQAMR